MKPHLWTLGVRAMVAALAASGCTTPTPTTVTPTATATATPCAACMVNATPNPLANLTVDEQGLVPFVNEAAAYARSNGRDAVIAAYNNRNGSFVRDDLYVFAYDMNGTADRIPVPTRAGRDQPVRCDGPPRHEVRP
jgi:cytochrome c